MAPLTTAQFQSIVLQYYAQSGRHDLAWRKPLPDGSYDPYLILVSEIMLQQTQVSRVTTKFEEFTTYFPTVKRLANASQAEVVRLWSGLGYNRRARFLHQAAGHVVNQFQGNIPYTTTELRQLPGVGINTAGAIMAYAFNLPAVFIETNIRSVMIYHFMPDQTEVSDREIAALVDATLDRSNPRQWYYAVMDYGSFLKRSVGNISQASRSYSRQSSFIGSTRQIRGNILKLLAENSLNRAQLTRQIRDERLEAVLADLLREGLIQNSRSGYSL
jgi:A/G-specific adenine glycosylase